MELACQQGKHLRRLGGCEINKAAAALERGLPATEIGLLPGINRITRKRSE